MQLILVQSSLFINTCTAAQERIFQFEDVSCNTSKVHGFKMLHFLLCLFTNRKKLRCSQTNFDPCFCCSTRTGHRAQGPIHESRTSLTHAAVSAGLPRVSRGADAHEGADQVLAGHAFAGAVVQSGFTLVVVWRQRRRQV